jgi:hypothetical protein
VLGARDRDIFQQIAPRIHHSNNGAGQRLPKRQRAEHREQRDRVDAHPPGHRVANDQNQEACRDRNRRSRPDEVCNVAIAGDAGEQTRRQSKHGTATTISARRSVRSQKIVVPEAAVAIVR